MSAFEGHWRFLRFFKRLYSESHFPKAGFNQTDVDETFEILLSIAKTFKTKLFQSGYKE